MPASSSPFKKPVPGVPNLILCGAFAPEIEPLLDLHNRLVRLPGGELRRLLVREAGIGNLSAALSLTRWAREDQPLEVVFLGSCGQYEESHPPVKASADHVVSSAGRPLPYPVFSREFFSRDLAFFEGRAKALDSFGGPVQSDPGPLGNAIRNRLVGGFSDREISVNCPGSISLVGLAPSVISRSTGLEGFDFVENMEAYGLAVAAREQGLAFSVLLAVTNRVGPQGSAEWLRNHSEGAAMVCSLVRDLLEAEGEGSLEAITED